MARKQATAKTASRWLPAARRRRPRSYGPLLILLLATPADAHCHIYRVWHYPKPQRCFTALAPLPVTKHASRPPETFHERIDIPLPELEWDVCPDGDDRLLGIAKLRALGNGS